MSEKAATDNGETAARDQSHEEDYLSKGGMYEMVDGRIRLVERTQEAGTPVEPVASK